MHAQSRAAIREKGLLPSPLHCCKTETNRTRNPTTSVLTATTLIYAVGAGITAAAGTRLALQLFLTQPIAGHEKDVNFAHSDKPPFIQGTASVFLVTTSPCREWVICAPAAFLRSGSRFSGSLSGIEP